MFIDETFIKYCSSSNVYFKNMLLLVISLIPNMWVKVYIIILLLEAWNRRGWTNISCSSSFPIQYVIAISLLVHHDQAIVELWRLTMAKHCLYITDHCHIIRNMYAVSLITMIKLFSVPQIEYPLGGSCKKGSHVYFLLQDFWVMLLFCQIVLLYDINVVLMSQ